MEIGQVKMEKRYTSQHSFSCIMAAMTTFVEDCYQSWND